MGISYNGSYNGYLGAYAIGKYTPKKVSETIPKKSCCKVNYPVNSTESFCSKCGKPLTITQHQRSYLEHISFLDLVEEHPNLEELNEVLNNYLSDLKDFPKNTNIFISNITDVGIFFDGRTEIVLEEITNTDIENEILKFKNRFSSQFEILKNHYDSIEFKYGLIYYFS